MSASRRGLGIDVLQAARRRVADALSAAERAYVSFSGGKDSTVLLHLVMEEAIRIGRKVGVLFIDLEAQYALTIEHTLACFERYAQHIQPFWVSLPINLRNAVSMYEPQWCCWEPGRESDWVRQPPPIAITDEKRFPFYRRRMEFEQFVPAFADWYADGHPTACFVGIRSQESLNRWRTIASTTKTRINNWCWSTVMGDRGAWNAYPLYDWRTEDIWTYHARHPEQPANRVYELMSRAGLTIHQARLCQPYGDDQRKGLWLFHVLEPETWCRVVARVQGANQGALYAQERGNVLGVGRIALPNGQTWRSYAELLLCSMPATTAEHYRAKIDIFQRWWSARGYPDGIPDEAERDEEASRSAPSWRRICKALLRHDYWCKGLSFSPQDTASYARYMAMIRKRGGQRRSTFETACGPDLPGKPSAKQLALAAALTGGSTAWHGYKAIGAANGRSGTWAKRRATRQNAADAIKGLLDTEAEYKAEQYSHRAERRPTRATGLAGEHRRAPGGRHPKAD